MDDGMSALLYMVSYEGNYHFYSSNEYSHQFMPPDDLDRTLRGFAVMPECLLAT